jgi:hypothetical protein
MNNRNATNPVTCTVTFNAVLASVSLALSGYRGRTLTTEQEINDFIATVKAAIASTPQPSQRVTFSLSTADGEYSVEFCEEVTATSQQIRPILWGYAVYGSDEALKFSTACSIILDALEGDYEPQATDANEDFYSQAFGL